jgi:hypothetical protein
MEVITIGKILVKKVRKSRKHKPKAQSFKYNSTRHDGVSKIRRDKRRNHNDKMKNFIQPTWWNDEAERTKLDKRSAVKNWQNAQENRIALPDHFLLLKQDLDKNECMFKRWKIRQIAIVSIVISTSCIRLWSFH